MEPIKGAKYYINGDNSDIGIYTGLSYTDFMHQQVYFFLLDKSYKGYCDVINLRTYHPILKSVPHKYDKKMVAFRHFEDIRLAIKYYPNIELFKKLYPNGKEINNMWEVNL